VRAPRQRTAQNERKPRDADALSRKADH
jgi:hypothetical protein